MVTVVKPLRHEKLLTRHRCYAIIVFNWVVGAAIAASKYRQSAIPGSDVCIYFVRRSSGFSGLTLLTYAVSVVIPGVVLVYATVKIFLVVVRTHAAINRQVHAVNAVDVNTGSAGLVTLKAIRSAKNVLVICIVSILLTLPMSAMLLVRLMTDNTQSTALAFIGIWLFFSNTFLNSLLYITLYRSTRRKTGLMLVSVYEFLRRC
ncbi:hypothetical protein LSAT2_026910 [Lamellibrachia satsuma]|nr:hypothetical protein LSAT2_026910 [Lamellibrachia satsuma]